MRVLYILYHCFPQGRPYGMTWFNPPGALAIGMTPSECEWIVPGTAEAIDEKPERLAAANRRDDPVTIAANSLDF